MKILIRIIAVLEIVGGVTGLGFFGWLLLTGSWTIASLLFGVLITAIDILAIVGGVALWRGTPFGRKASILIQLIQIPKIISPTIIFLFSFGFDLWIHFLTGNELSTIGFQTAVFASTQFFLNVPGAPTGIGVSITGIVFLLVLLKHKPEEPRESLPPPPPSDFVTPIELDPQAQPREPDKHRTD